MKAIKIGPKGEDFYKIILADVLEVSDYWSDPGGLYANDIGKSKLWKSEDLSLSWSETLKNLPLKPKDKFLLILFRQEDFEKKDYEALIESIKKLLEKS